MVEAEPIPQNCSFILTHVPWHVDTLLEHTHHTQTYKMMIMMRVMMVVVIKYPHMMMRLNKVKLFNN